MKEEGRHIIHDAITKIRWHIYYPILHGLTYEEIDFIRTFNPTIYWSDERLTHWAFDTKMPSGRWLADMKIDLAKHKIEARVF